MLDRQEARRRVDSVARQVPQQWRIASTTCVFGSDLGGRVVELTRGVGWRRCLCIADPAVLHTPEVAALLQSFPSGAVTVWSDVVPHVPDRAIAAAVRVAQEVNPDWVLSIGGGSAHDTAKLVALQLAHEGVQLQSLVADGPTPLAVIDNSGVLPLVAMPATLAGAEVTGVAGFVSTIEGRKRVVVSASAVPRVVVLSPQLLARAPSALFTGTGINAVHHALESWMGLKANPVSDAFAGIAGRILLPALSVGVDDSDYSLRAAGAALCGANLAGHAIWSSGSALGHAICHVLGGAHGVPHGVANAVVLPRVVAFYAAREPERLGALLTHWHDGMTSMDFITWISALTRSVGLPRSLGSIGLSRSVGSQLVATVAHERQFTNTRNMRPDDRDLLTLISNLWDEEVLPVASYERTADE